jgi:hypothetical protein
MFPNKSFFSFHITFDHQRDTPIRNLVLKVQKGKVLAALTENSIRTKLINCGDHRRPLPQFRQSACFLQIYEQKRALQQQCEMLQRNEHVQSGQNEPAGVFSFLRSNCASLITTARRRKFSD